MINTHRMLCSNQQAMTQGWPFLRDRPPVVVDWLPWSHTFGGNHNFSLALWHGGTLWVDRGKPVPGRIEETVATLRLASPTIYFNVPRGFDALLPFFEADEDLARGFFEDLDLLFYAAAGTPHGDLLRDERLRERIHAALQGHNRAQGEASSRAVASAVLLEEPPSIDAGEITDKGYINQRAVLERRAALVEALYAPDAPDAIRVR